MTTRIRWRVRTVVPFTAPVSEWFGYQVEKIRPRRNGVDGGLYLVRSPDRIARVAIVRGLVGRNHILPHRIHQLDDQLELGRELARVWRFRHDAPDLLCDRDRIGSFRTARKFACQHARRLYRAALAAQPQDGIR